MPKMHCLISNTMWGKSYWSNGVDGGKRDRFCKHVSLSVVSLFDHIESMADGGQRDELN